MGADDYIAKPFAAPRRERVRAALRRFSPKDAQSAPGSGARAGTRQAKLDPERHTCHWDERPATLTVTEFLILQALGDAPRRRQDAGRAHGCRV